MLPIIPDAELPNGAATDAVTDRLDAENAMRREAVTAGELWETYAPPLIARSALNAAANAYSAAWESSRHQVGDHLRALRSAIAAADPILARWHVDGAKT